MDAHRKTSKLYVMSDQSVNKLTHIRSPNTHHARTCPHLMKAGPDTSRLYVISANQQLRPVGHPSSTGADNSAGIQIQPSHSSLAIADNPSSNSPHAAAAPLAVLRHMLDKLLLLLLLLLSPRGAFVAA
jgi:hypothetical protein